MDRREFLRDTTVATAVITGLAGCGAPAEPTDTGDGGIGDGTETETGIFDDETETDSGDETETDSGGDETETETDLVDIDVLEGESPDNVEVSNTQLQRTGSDAVVTGMVENTGDQSIDEVEVAVTLLDDNDEIIGQFFHSTRDAEVESLAAGATWEFSIMFPGEDLEDAAAYRIDVDTDINDTVDFDLDLGTETSSG